MKSNEEYEQERIDLKKWRERDALRQGNAARPVRSKRVYQRNHKYGSKNLDQE